MWLIYTFKSNEELRTRPIILENFTTVAKLFCDYRKKALMSFLRFFLSCLFLSLSIFNFCLIFQFLPDMSINKVFQAYWLTTKLRGSRIFLFCNQPNQQTWKALSTDTWNISFSHTSASLILDVPKSLSVLKMYRLFYIGCIVDIASHKLIALANPML